MQESAGQLRSRSGGKRRQTSGVNAALPPPVMR